MNQDINTQWHQGFYGATELEFDEDKNNLEFIKEYQIGKEPLRTDLLLIKKSADIITKNEIGHIFKKYNIFEYKSPEKTLSIDVYYKAVAYASLFKSKGTKENHIPASEITISLVREGYPRELIKELRKEGMVVEECYPGIFYVKGAPFITQIVVTSRIRKGHHFLRVLSEKANEEDVINFIRISEKMNEQGQQNNIDVLYQISLQKNKEIYDEIKRRNPEMCEALREFMKPEIDEAVNKAVAEAVAEAVIKAEKETINKIASRFALKQGITFEEALRLIEE